MTRVHKTSVMPHLQGTFCDVLRDAQGRVIWSSGWRTNVIVVDCRRLLAGFMLGQSDTLGIQGLRIGAGDAAWDAMPGPPPPTPTTTALTDLQPHLVPRDELDISYLDVSSDASSVTPTNKIQIRATLKPGIPAWPDLTHSTSTLREFGLVARLNSTTVLINYVRHVAIAKDPTSTLERTLWLVF